jgi:hypothetical protein
MGLGVADKVLIKFKIVNGDDLADHQQIFQLMLIIFLFHEIMVAHPRPFVNPLLQINSLFSKSVLFYSFRSCRGIVFCGKIL